MTNSASPPSASEIEDDDDFGPSDPDLAELEEFADHLAEEVADNESLLDGLVKPDEDEW